MNIDPLAPRAPYEVSPRHYSVSHQMATTAFELPNFQVMQTLGVVRGIVVRSPNVSTSPSGPRGSVVSSRSSSSAGASVIDAEETGTSTSETSVIEPSR